MIFRTKNGDLVNIVRSNFKTDTDYYSHIVKICGGITSNYKNQLQNIEAIESIISK